MRARKAVPGPGVDEAMGDVEVGAALVVEVFMVFAMLIESDCELKEMLCWVNSAS